MADLFSSVLGGAVGGTAVGAALVRLSLDSKQYQAQLAGAKGQTTAGLNAMGASANTFSTAMKAGLLVGGALLVKFVADAVNAASDLGESLNKVRVIFGTTADQVIAFSETSAESLGISQSAALDAAASFGAMAQSAGLSAQASADMSLKLVTLAADMASFNNQDPSEMLEKLRSGLAGEAEPLRQYGVFISDARVKTEAYTSGIAALGSELTDAQKVQARYNVILADTTKQQGDFARTVGESMPNQLRVLKAELTDLSAELGVVLLPVMVRVLTAFRDFIALLQHPLTGQAVPSMKELSASIVGTGEDAELTRAFLERLKEQGSDLAAEMLHLATTGDKVAGVFRTLGPIITGPFVSLQAAMDKAGDKASHFAGMTVKEFGAWRSGMTESLNFVEQAFDDLGGEAKVTADEIVRAFARALADQAAFAKNSTNFLGQVAEALGPRMQTAAEQMVAALAEKGPEGAKLMAALADATDKQLKKMLLAWLAAEGGADQYLNKLRQIPSDITTNVHFVGGFTPQQLGGHHSGGPVGGPAGGDVPAMLQEGEWVINRESARRIGPAILAGLNQMHSGGQVRHGAGWGHREGVDDPKYCIRREDGSLDCFRDSHGAGWWSRQDDERIRPRHGADIIRQGHGAQGGGASVNIYQYFTGDNFSADLPDMIEEGARRALVMLGRP